MSTPLGEKGMVEQNGTYKWMRIQQLPKPEYRLMKALQEEYGLDSPTELFTVLLVLAYEIGHMHDGIVVNGEGYIRRLIDQVRSTSVIERQYENG